MRISGITIFNFGAFVINLIGYHYSSKPSELNIFCAGVSFAVFLLCAMDDYSDYRNS